MAENGASTRWPLNALKQFGGLAGTLGLILYGVLRLDHALFYGQLGVKPEEVGLGYAELLSQSVTGIVLVCGFIFAFLAIFFFAYGIMVSAVVREIRGVRSRSKPTAAALAPLASQVETDSPVTSEGRSASSASPVRVISLVSVLVVLGVAAWQLVPLIPDVARTVIAVAVTAAAYLQVARVELSDKDTFLRRRWRGIMLVAAALATVLVLALLSLIGWEQGGHVQRGRPVRPTFGPILVAGWGADFATITTTPGADQPRDAAERCLMYLGEAKGKAVFYDPKEQQSLRIPSSGLTITVYHPPSRAPASCRFDR